MALIYKIKCLETNQVYIGSTKSSLEKRMYYHENLCNRWKEGKANFCSSYPIIETNNYESTIIENCLLENKGEREKYWVSISKEEGNCVNKNIPNRNMAEWYQDNKERWKNHMKKYYHNKKEKKKEKIETNALSVPEPYFNI